MKDVVIHGRPRKIDMPVLVVMCNKQAEIYSSQFCRTVQALATPIKQYSWTFGYTLFFPLLVLGQKFSTQSKSLTIFGGNTISASSVPDISKEITFKIFSRFEGSRST